MLFDHSYLDLKLRERLNRALTFISSISQQDVASCDDECLSEVVHHFGITSPILLLDLMHGDETIIESFDVRFERKSGQTYHSFFIPIQHDFEWLKEIENQYLESESGNQGFPLAFLDEKRSRISIRLGIGPEDEEGALGERLAHRSKLVAEYADSVGERLADFNRDLAKQVAADFAKRKNALLKATRELARTRLPLTHNPEHEEREIRNQKLIRRLTEGFANMGQNSTEKNLLVVLAAMNDIANEKGSQYVGEAEIVAETGLSLHDVRDYMDILEERRMTNPSNSASERMAAVSANGRATLRDPDFKISHAFGSIVVQGNHGVMVNIGSTLQDVNQTINVSSHLPDDKKQDLSDLIEQLREALSQVPPEQEEDAEVVAKQAKVLVEEASREKPNPKMVALSAEGLAKAAKNISAVVGIVEKILGLTQ